MKNNALLTIGSSYNLKVKVAGNTIEFKRYRVSQKAIKKGESENTFVPFSLSEEELKKYDVDTTPIDREQEKEQKYYKNLRATRSKAFDLINANVRNNKDYFGNHQRIKFMTLTFGDEVMVDKIEFAYECLTKFMQRLSYHHFKVKNNVIKYFSTFELQPSGRIHFHVVVFNMPYTSNKSVLVYQNDYEKGAQGCPQLKNTLQDIWGHGFVGINALKRKNGKNIDIDKIAGYVIKYMTKGTKIENGQVKIDNLFQELIYPKGYEKGVQGAPKRVEQDIYTYENYKKFGLENVKKYSASKGLKKPDEYKAFIDAGQFKELLKKLKAEKHFKKVYEKDDKKKFEYLKGRSFSVVVNNVHINDIWVANGNLKFESIEVVRQYLEDLERNNKKIIKGSFEILKKKSYDELKWIWNEFDKSRAVFNNDLLFDYNEKW